MRYVVIMAGGSGTRLWPLSRQGTPKQLLPLIGGRSLLRLAFERSLASVPAEQIVVVTGAAYADQVAVLGPLATYAEPHSYDLCDQHAERLTAPRGWEVVRLATDGAPPQTHDDLVALANVVREAKRPSAPPANLSPPPSPPGSRRSHLRAVPSASSTD